MKINKLKENWYFIRQDIVSYLIPTAFYIILCLIKEPFYQRALYGLFECLVFYVPFWFIRVCFSDTYHSNSWKHCKMWTRIMLCSGVFAIWLFPIEYSLIASIGVSLICCLILYLVAIETNEKKFYLKKNQELEKKINELLAKDEDPKEKLLSICREKNISERETKIAIMYYIERKKPKQIWIWMCENNENVEYDTVYKILNRLNKKINSQK